MLIGTYSLTNGFFSAFNQRKSSAIVLDHGGSLPEKKHGIIKIKKFFFKDKQEDRAKIIIHSFEDTDIGT